MTHLPHLIQDLGLILVAAALVSVLCKAVRQPVVLGYLLVGCLVGPHFSFFPTVKDTASVAIWAEIGVIFMLFGLGLEFSFPKLAKVGKSASITATFEIVFMLGAGFLAGRLLGWSTMDSLFLGGILSISSTTIIARAFEELGLKGRGFVSLVFGVLIVEDLIAILLLVLLSSVAATQGLSGAELFGSAIHLGYFLVLWFLLGIYLLPIFFRKLRALLSDETMLLVSIGFCLAMVVAATEVGFSPALGAFVMGSLLAGTREGHRIEKLIQPVKNLFSAVFFVSVGMLIDPKVLAEHWGVIALLTAVTVGGKFVSTALGALLSGRSTRHSIQAGLSLAQIGEFSFIIATLGMTLKVTSGFLHPIAVAVSAVTTFLTPYLIRQADPVAAWVDRRLPAGIKASLSRYESAMAMSSGRGVLSLVWREYGLQIALNTVMVVAITLALRKFSAGESDTVRIGACGAALFLSGPFLYAISFGGPRHANAYAGDLAERLRRLQLGLAIFRFSLGFLLVGLIVSQFTSPRAVSSVLLASAAALGILLFTRFSEPVYRKVEARFLANLNENERAALAAKEGAPELAPWNATLAEFTLSPSSPLVAKTLQESGIKEAYGVTLTMIERGDRRILAPTRDDRLLPYDRVFLVGTDEQLGAARGVIETPAGTELPPLGDAIGLTPLVLYATDPYVGRPIRECGLREAVNGLIVGIERAGERHLSPDSSMILQAGDLVWIVGDRSRIRALRGT